MFKIYFRNIINSLSKNIFLTLLCITVVAIINQINLIIGLSSKSTNLYLEIIKVCIHMIPYLVSVIMPFAVLIGTMMLLYRYRRENIILSLQNLGLGPSKLFKPFYLLVGIIVVFNYLIYLFLVPESYKEFKNIQNNFKKNYISNLIEVGVIRTYAPELTIYVNEESDDGFFHGIFISDMREKGFIRTFTAKRGTIFFSKNQIGLELYNGSYQELNNQKNNFLTFNSYSLTVENEVLKNSILIDPQSMSLTEMIQFENNKNEVFNKVKVSLHNKILWPLYSVIFLTLCLKVDWIINYSSYTRFLKLNSAFITIILCFIMSATNFFLQSLSLKFLTIGIIMMYFLPIFLLQIALRMLESISKNT